MTSKPRRPALFRTGTVPTGRVEAFSDGVLAVVITLLVLEVKLPAGLANDAALWEALRHLAPVVAAWAVSFAFVLVFWVSHHYFFASLERTDRGLLFLNGLFLLNISLTPFPTGLVGEYPTFTAPLVLLSAVMLTTSLSFALMRLYATFHADLTHAHVDADRRRAAMMRSAVAPLLYAVALVLAVVWPPGSIGVQVLVLLIFFLNSPSRHSDAQDGA